MGDFDTRLTGAAVRARDDLRMTILPGLAKLAPLLSGNAEALALIDKLTSAAAAQADSLRLAVKDRTPRERREMHLPCWTSKSSPNQ